MQTFDEKLLASAISYLIDGQELYEASLLLLCNLKSSESDDYSYVGNQKVHDLNIEITGNRIIYEIMQDDEHPAVTTIRNALTAVIPTGFYFNILTCRVAFTDFSPDWRNQLLEAIKGKTPLNQCLPYEDKPRYSWAYLFFRSTYEIAIAKALDEYPVLFLPNCAVRFSQEKINKEADFLVCFNGKWGIIEVDGPHHDSTVAQDQERDRLFGSHRIKVIQHFTIERCIANPKGVVKQFLDLLDKNG